MSSLRGEQALKDGLSFEFTWTARHLIEVLEERAESIRLGGFADEFGVDFCLCFEGREEHHQVKRAYGTEGDWTLASLDHAKVLADFANRLSNPSVCCHFVSTLPSIQLRYLAQRARKADNFADFQANYLGGDYQRWFNDLEKRWILSAGECWERLKRVEARHIDEQDIELSSLTMLGYLVTGDPRAAWTRLRDFCFAHMHKQIRASDLWHWLESGGIRRKVMEGDLRVVASLAVQTERYLNGIRRKLIQPPIPREVSGRIIAAMSDAIGGQDIIILGAPGGGKSAVMLEISNACIAKGWPVLSFRLDELSSSITPIGMQEALDLPVSPARAIAFAAAGKPAVVVIDQLDAVSHYSGRTSILFDRVSELVSDIRGHRLRSPIHLVIACRDVDWRHDGRFRKLHRPENCTSDEREGIYHVEDLTDGELQAILTSNGFDAQAFTTRQKDQLLRRPQNLAVLIEAHPSAEEVPLILTAKQLFDAWWDRKQRDLAIRFEATAQNQWSEILRGITAKLSETALSLVSHLPGSAINDAPLAVPKRQLDNFSPLIVDWMLTNGVLAEGGNRIRFAHESFFDYCFARFFEEKKESLLQYLLRSDQTLIQRGQLRQVLEYQRHEDMLSYLVTIRELLGACHLRPHLRQLLVLLICGVQEPTQEEWEFLRPYLDASIQNMDAGQFDTVACQLFFAFAESLPLFRQACSSGAFANWLAVGAEASTDRLIRILLKHQNAAQTEVWRQIEPLIGVGRYDKHLDWLSNFCRASASRETLEWLMGVMRFRFSQGPIKDDFLERFHSLVDDLSENQPTWLGEWMAEVIRIRRSSVPRNGYEILSSRTTNPEAFELAAAARPSDFVRHVLPAVIETLELDEHRWWGVWSGSGSDEDEEGVSDGYRAPDSRLFMALLKSLRRMAVDDAQGVAPWLERLYNSPAKACRRLHAAILCGEEKALAPYAAELLLSGSDILDLGYRQQPAAGLLLKNHAEHFSISQLCLVERRILDCYPEDQNQFHGRKYPEHRDPFCWGNYRGHQQMVLLKSFPFQKLSPNGKKRLEELKRKFASLRKSDNERAKDKSLNAEVAIRLSPARFLAALTARKSRQSGRWRGDGFGSESKISTVMAEAIKMNAAAFIEHLCLCSGETEKIFIREVAQTVSRLDLPSLLALKAARELHRLGSDWAHEIVTLLGKLPADEMTGEALNLLMDYATAFPPPEIKWDTWDEGKGNVHLDSIAVNSVRGQAIEVLCHKIWNDPSLVPVIKDRLPEMVKEPNAALRGQLASICYALAVADSNRSFAWELFAKLATEELPDDRVLATNWPFKFMLTGFETNWPMLHPIFERMIGSEHTEVRAAGARLALIAVVAGKDALVIATRCVASTDPKVRKACADVLSHNLNVEAGKPWTTMAFLTLANDPDKEVCRTTGHGFSTKRSADLGQLASLLAGYVKTRAFLYGPSRLIDALSESRSVLPDLVFEIIESLICRLGEPAEDNFDRLAHHVKTVTTVLKRLYHENRDTALRRRALDLIDALCVHCMIKSESLDE